MVGEVVKGLWEKKKYCIKVKKEENETFCVQEGLFSASVGGDLKNEWRSHEEGLCFEG